jgi:hypothetical protein
MMGYVMALGKLVWEQQEEVAGTTGYEHGSEMNGGSLFPGLECSFTATIAELLKQYWKLRYLV